MGVFSAVAGNQLPNQLQKRVLPALFHLRRPSQSTTFSPWTHTPDDSYIYQLSLVLATATVSYLYIFSTWQLVPPLFFFFYLGVGAAVLCCHFSVQHISFTTSTRPSRLCPLLVCLFLQQCFDGHVDRSRVRNPAPLSYL